MNLGVRLQKQRYNKKIFFLVILLIIFLFPFISSFARYAIKNVSVFFSKSKEFYFYSDKLGEDNPAFLIDNWSGVDDYPITVHMNSMKNNILGAQNDIDYNISYTCSNNAICTLSKTSGTILAENNSDVFTIIVTPNTQLKTGDTVEVNISATTSTTNSLYDATISGKFTLKVGIENITYTIDDSKNNPYMQLNVTNTQSYYFVDEPFNSYSKNDRITSDEYIQLSDENKNKCHSAIITLEFDPNEIVLDMTNENYLKAIDIETTSINLQNYIKKITFKLEAISSTTVRFYKKDISKNYTYPNSSNASVVEFLSR